MGHSPLNKEGINGISKKKHEIKGGLKHEIISLAFVDLVSGVFQETFNVCLDVL